MSEIIPWILSILNIILFYLMGTKWKYVWLLGISSQFLWIYWIIKVGHTGLLLSSVVILLVFIRNQYLWYYDKTNTHL